jgi:hypothetical protein
MSQRKHKVRANLLVPCLGLVLVSFGTTAFAWPATIDFRIDKGRVIPTQPFAARIEVIGAALSTESEPLPVTLLVQVGDETTEPFGPFERPVEANVNDDRNPRCLVIDAMHEPGEVITVAARSWKRHVGDGTKDEHWTPYRQQDTHTASPFVKVLRDGDDVPDIAGLRDQASVAEYVGDYIDAESGTIVLGENQAIYLFELGTSNLKSAAADFQDLVVVVTLGESVDALRLSEVSALLAD